MSGSYVLTCWKCYYSFIIYLFLYCRQTLCINVTYLHVTTADIDIKLLQCWSRQEGNAERTNKELLYTYLTVTTITIKRSHVFKCWL